jgi:polysaccharide export outer membrane protein
MQALASAGGITVRGTEKGIRVNRRDASGNMQVLTIGMQDKLQKDDVIYIRESLF